MTQKPPTNEELDEWEKFATYWLYAESGDVLNDAQAKAVCTARDIIRRLIPALRGVRQYASEVWTFQERIKTLEDKITSMQRCHGESDHRDGGW